MESYAVGKKRRIVLYALMLLMLVGFFAAELIYPSERSESMKLENIAYQGKLTWQKPDGTQEVIKAPGSYDVGVDETMVITTRLPEDYSENTLAIRSSLQDVSFYIDGKLRMKYDTVNTRPFGKNSASRYVFCPTSQKDSGKEVRIELTTHTANYTGVVNTIYCGDRGDIWAQIFDRYGLETVMAFFILFAGVITVLFSIALRIAYHTRFDMEYLGWCMIVGAIWMISESKLRQLWVPNASIVASMCFVVVMLCPIPLLFYIDSVQKGKYRRLYHYVEGIAALNFVISTVLQLTGVADYIQTLPVAHGVLAISFVAIGGTFVKDIRSGAAREYHLVLIGMVITMISVGIEAASVYFVVTMSGVFIGIGLSVLLFVNIIRTIKNVRDMEQNRQKQEARQQLLDGSNYSFQRTASEMEVKVRALPGLIENFDKKADRFAARMNELEAKHAAEMETLKPENREIIENQISEYHQYTDANGVRRLKIDALDDNNAGELSTITSVRDFADETEAYIEEYEEDEDEEDDLDEDALWREVAYAWDDVAVPQSDEHTGIADEETEKKLESLLDIVNSGFLGLVVPEDREVSERTLETALLPSKTSVTERDSSLLRDLMSAAAVDAYAGKFLTSFTDNAEQRPLFYELEYAVAGKDSDKENLSSALRQILVIREALNFMYIMTDI